MTVTSSLRRDSLGICWTQGCHGEVRRKFVVALHRPMQEHFNHTTMKPVSDMRQFRDQLKAAGEKATEETGIPHSYAPVDLKELAQPE